MGGLRERLSLMPQILKEVFTHPSESSILVKQGDEVIVARKGADLHGKDLDGLVFRRADLRKANLEGADLSDASFEEADLRGANLSGVTVTGTTAFRGADLREVTADPDVLRQAKSEGARVDDSVAGTA
ncbi:MAG: pentapeptide repeat-containing protein [Rubrobacter sp.]|nr:pentapeptide repeat-containing protein [Rubrobacter sp.]